MKYLSFLIPFCLYFLTTPLSVPFGDSGEFITAACSLGIPHPPGFPIYVVLGKLFCFLPVHSMAFRINLMSGFFGALTCLMVYVCLVELKKKEWISLLAALSLATSQLFWQASRIAEVYTLHTFLASLVFYFCLRYRNDGQKNHRHLIFLFLGLGFANHWPLVVLILPATFFLLINSRKENRVSWLKSSLFFFLGLTPYLLIPVFSLSDPGIDWGHPQTLTNFLIHVSRYDTSESFSNWNVEDSFKLLRYTLIEVVGKDFTWVGCMFSLLGMVGLWRSDKILFLSILSGWLGTLGAILIWVRIPWAGVWIDSVVISYSAVSFLVALLIGFGMDFLYSCVNQRRKYSPSS